MFRPLVLGIVALLAFGQPASAQQVLVSPGSVIFEDGERSAQFFVGNTGDVTSLFTLEPTFFRMEANGRLNEVTPPFPENSAAELIRFSPRQFELAPGESQFVRMATRLPESLPEGEYRVHLRVTNVGEAQLTPEISATEDGTMVAVVRIQVARAVRILVRHGVNAGHASLAEVTARRAGSGKLVVASELARSGKGSSKGSYRVYTRDGSGKVRDEFAHRGVLIYSELPKRIVEDTVPASAVRGGVKLCVAYRDETAGAGGEKERCVRPG